MENNLEKQRELAEQIHAKTRELAALAAEAMKLRMVVSVQVMVLPNCWTVSGSI